MTKTMTTTTTTTWRNSDATHQRLGRFRLEAWVGAESACVARTVSKQNATSRIVPMALATLHIISCLAASQRMLRPPPPGVYAFPPLPDIQVLVHTPTTASVRWAGSGRAGVRYDSEDDVFWFDEPLAASLRRAGVVVTRVDFDETQNALFVSFDGRLRFMADLRPTSA